MQLPILLLLVFSFQLSSQATSSGGIAAAREEITNTGAGGDNGSLTSRSQPLSAPPNPIGSASYVSLDGLTLVVLFDRPINLGALIESVERRRSSALESPPSEHNRPESTTSPADNGSEMPLTTQPPDVEMPSSTEQQQQFGHGQQQHQCQELRSTLQHEYETQHLVQGIQLCAKLLTKKTLKFLHKYRLYNCLWPSRVQFMIQLGRPVVTSAEGGQPIKVTFQRGALSEHGQHSGDSQAGQVSNEREVSVELNKLPLESLGLPLAPKLALTGPNQVPPCGQFTLSAHLSSPFGTWPGESVKLSWSVERLGFVAKVNPRQQQQQQQAGGNQTIGADNNNSGQQQETALQMQQASELKWRALQHLVKSSRGNNLILDAQLLNFMPQLYEFHATATFTTSVSSVTLNATHQITKVDFEAPIGTVYGSHLLGQHQQVNTHQDLVLLADVRVPECASNIKQVGLYWQVSDPRVKFEQTYAPYYLAKANTLPEQSSIEFRVNLFYGIRVKKYTSSGTTITTGDSVLDAQISDGLLIVSAGQEPATAWSSVGSSSAAGIDPAKQGDGNHQQQQQLELFGAADSRESDKYTYQWSCFDGKTAQPCFKSLKMLPSNSSTGYEVGSLAPVVLSAAGNSASSASAATTAANAAQQPTSSGVLLIDRQRQRQPVLRLPLGWFESDAQLWFGLQRFDRQNPSQHSQTEYTLVSVQPGPSPVVSIGPVLIGHPKIRATIRNPLTGAVMLVPNTPTVIVGRLGPRNQIKSFAWHSPNYIQPLHWTSKNATNPLTGQEELVTELHLNPGLQVAYAHYQIQLIACSASTGAITTATLNLDIVQGVSECRVEANQNALTNSLVISVDYCNIPLGLSPITYQIYVADTTGIDGFVSDNSNNSYRAASSAANQLQPEDDYINESDEAYLESQMQPMSAPQLSPIFSLNGLDVISLLALLEQPAPGGGTSEPSVASAASARVRFGARVCDRLQNCRLFYSHGIGLEHLLAGGSGSSGGSSNGLTGNQSMALSGGIATNAAEMRAKLQDVTRNRASLIQSLQTMIDRSRRLNTAGNSIAAISVLGGVMNLCQKMLQTQQSRQRNNKLRQQQQQFHPDQSSNIVDERIRELLQVAMRECLHYGSISVQRQFHYTDSGQANLVTHALARILSQPQSSVELKFRAMRLLSQVTRRSINEQLNLKLNCLADLRTLQSGYESLADTFSQHTIGASERHLANNMTSGGAHTRFPTFISSLSTAFASNSSQQPAAHNHHGHHRHHSPRSNNVSRKKREEAILAYLRSIRQAYRSLLAAAAMQLPLGANQQFQYVGDGTGAESSDSNSSNNKVPTADIASSLTHLTEIPSNTIDIDLHDFGTISLKFQEKLLDKLKSNLNELCCRNSNPNQTKQQQSTTNCSSFVLAVSSFAGKAPFRSLDETTTLRVPILEVSLMSPIDGSNLLDLMREQWSPSSSSPSDRHLQLDDFKITVTFNISKPAEASTIASAAATSTTTSVEKQNEPASKRRFKCYQFDETANEWSRPAESESDSDEQHVATASDEQAQLITVKCSFNALGIFGAFQGIPPPAEASMRLSVMLTVTAILALVVVITILGCFASREKQRNGNKSDDDDDSENNHHAPARHPEQTYRNKFNYPLG